MPAAHQLNAPLNLSSVSVLLALWTLASRELDKLARLVAIWPHFSYLIDVHSAGPAAWSPKIPSARELWLDCSPQSVVCRQINCRPSTDAKYTFQRLMRSRRPGRRWVARWSQASGSTRQPLTRLGQFEYAIKIMVRPPDSFHRLASWPAGWPIVKHEF